MRWIVLVAVAIALPVCQAQTHHTEMSEVESKELVDNNVLAVEEQIALFVEAVPEISEVTLLGLVTGAVDPEVASITEFSEASEEDQETIIERTLRQIEKHNARAEVWKCKDRIRPDKDLVTLAADFELEVGLVHLEGQRRRVTLTLLSGFERNWSWPCISAAQREPVCFFDIEANGDADFYTSDMSSSQYFKCREVTGE